MGARQSAPIVDDIGGGMSKWEQTVREEETIQAAALPPSDVPGCMALFDEVGKCYALVPQMRYVYRYGKMNDCKPKWEDFKFCLTLKGITKEEHRERWIRRRAEIMAAKRLEQSSEDIWELRRDPLVDPSYIDPCIPKPL